MPVISCTLKEFISFDRYPLSPRKSRHASLGIGFTLPGASTKSSSSPRSLTIRVPVDVLLRLIGPAKVL